MIKCFWFSLNFFVDSVKCQGLRIAKDTFEKQGRAIVL